MRLPRTAAAALLALSIHATTGAQAQPAEPLIAPAASALPGKAAVAIVNPQFHVRPVDDAWRASLPRDARAATQAYLDRLPPDVVQRANAYFEGGYWLLLWNFVLGLGIALLLLSGQRSARLREWAQRSAPRPLLRDALYGAVFSCAVWALSLPLALYQGYLREHAYGMSTQTLAAWFGEQLITLAVAMPVAAVAVAGLYGVIRRTGPRWWLWGTAGALGLTVLSLMFVPVFVDPLFNTYQRVEDPLVKHALLAMAHADGVPADDVYEFDGSRQTTRISANVSGLFGTAAIRLSDNLLRGTSLPQIRAVMGHEIGHYVMNHAAKMIAELTLMLVAAFLFAKWSMDRLLVRWGDGFGLRGIRDVAGLPLLLGIFSVFLFATTPLVNTLQRTQEVEADRFGLNLAREPHGEAEIDLRRTEFRKPDPGTVEEFIFFDHPSARSRIHEAMRWREAMGTP